MPRAAAPVMDVDDLSGFDVPADTMADVVRGLVEEAVAKATAPLIEELNALRPAPPPPSGPLFKHEFWSPVYPELMILIKDSSYPIRFTDGYYGTDDDDLAAYVRQAGGGAIHEADGDYTYTVPLTGWKTRSRPAYEIAMERAGGR